MNTPVNTPPVDTRHRTRNRWMLGLLFGLFFGAMFVAAALRFSGWRPEGMKNKGEPGASPPSPAAATIRKPTRAGACSPTSTRSGD